MKSWRMTDECSSKKVEINTILNKDGRAKIALPSSVCGGRDL
jgi:hypothetical protein